jgi:hypothetical protein
MAQWNRIISTKLVNEAKISFNRSPIVTDPVFDESKCCPEIMRFNPNITTRGGQPRSGEIFAGGGINLLGINQRAGRVNFQNRFQYIDNLSYASGAHSLKMGFNIHRIQVNYEASSFAAGGYTFLSIRDLVSNATPFQFSGTLSGAIMRGMRHTLVQLYLQDDWRVRPNLNLNVGLRYEPYRIPREVAGRISTTRRNTDTFLTVGNPLFEGNPSWGNFAPRFGFAWDPFGDGKTSIRSGYGLFFDLLQPVHYTGHSATNLPFSQFIVRRNPPFPDPREGLILEDPDSLVTGPTVFSNQVVQSSLHQFQISLQRELGQSFMVQVDYRGSRGFNLGHIADANYAIPTRDEQGIFPYWPQDVERPNPSFTQLRDRFWDAHSWYNALGLTVSKRFSRGWSLQGSYTFGKSIDEASSTGVVDTGGTPNGATHFPFDISYDRGLSGFDVRNRFVLTGSLDLPLGRGQALGANWGGALQTILGGWSINGILTAADGNHGTVQLSGNNSRSQANDGISSVADRPNLIPGGNNNPVLADGRDPSNYFDASQFEVGPPGYLGNLARGTIENPGLVTMDFSIFKDVNIDEERYIQFRAEFFNLFNRANFSQVGFRFSGSAVLFNRNLKPIPGATRITSTSSTARQLQFALKLYF